MGDDDKTWTTYRLADGESIMGEYAWVETIEFFDDIEEPLDVIKETWLRQSSEVVTLKPTGWDEAQADDEDVPA